MPQAMPQALLLSNGTNVRTNERTNRRISHLYIYPSPFVTHTRVSKTGIVGVWDRAGCAQLSEATA